MVACTHCIREQTNISRALLAFYQSHCKQEAQGNALHVRCQRLRLVNDEHSVQGSKQSTPPSEPRRCNPTQVEASFTIAQMTRTHRLIQ
jgi:hypothetical protein